VGERIEAWTVRHPVRIGGVSASALGVRVVQRFMDVRVMGLAAEMTYYALLSIFPLIGAVGASLGFMERLLGAEQAVAIEAAILSSLDLVFSREATGDVLAPIVAGLMREERAGFAVGSFLVTLFLASRIFRSAIDTLDGAYRVEERRSFLQLWGLGLLFALCAVLVGVILVAMLVVGPLLGGGRAIAEWLGLGAAFEWIWAFARFPVLLVAATAFLSLLYRFGPNARLPWRASLPGALFGMLTLILVATGFRLYIDATGLQSPQIADADDALLLALQAFGALMAVLLWVWLSAMVILTGGVVNAELRRLVHDSARHPHATLPPGESGGI
jgi:membrane protein